MTALDLGALARASEARVLGGALPQDALAVGTDTRSLPPGCLFVALRGENFDGHAFVRAAKDLGARAVLVDEAGDPGEIGIPRLVVKDTLFALGEMARAERTALNKPVVAVTGSSGKTTTKEMLACILAERGPVHSTRGNLNNLIGVPLTIFAWQPQTWAAVLEMGMNTPGEIARLTEIGDPDVGVITMVGAAHLEGLKTVDNIARAKGEMYEGLRQTSTGVVNADDPVVMRVALPLLANKPRLFFGTSERADVRVLSATQGSSGVTIRMRALGEELEAKLPMLGVHNALNAAGACAAASVLGLTRDEMVRGLAKVSVPGGRLRLVQAKERGLDVLDDTYNANPASMRAAFVATANASRGRKVAVLGSMFELGETAATLHREVGAAAAQAGIDWVLTLGEHAKDLAEGAQAAGGHGDAFARIEDLLAALDGGLRAGDFVLVKGSRGMKMERVVTHLTKGGA